MSFLPKFPITGNILSNNVALDRFSLVENPLGSNEYPAGQYVFYTKNKSLWYRYKTPTSNWTAETLYLVGGSQSNTKFDATGNPVTAWIDASGNVKVSRVVNKDLVTTTLATSGSLPTVVVTKEDTFVFWVPPLFTNYLYYVQLCDNFSVTNRYEVTLPGQIASLQIQDLPDSRLFFSFEVDTDQNRKVYVAFSNPSYQFVTSSLVAFVEFIYSHMLSDYFVVAEQAFSGVSTETSVSETVPADILTIGDAANFEELILVANKVSTSPEYFIVSAVESIQSVIDAITAYKTQLDILDLADSSPNSQLTLLVSHQSGLGDYLVVNSVSTDSVLTYAGSSNVLPTESFRLSDDVPTLAGLTFVGQEFVGGKNGQSFTDILLISDDVEANAAPIFTVKQYHAPKPVQDEMENYFIVSDMESATTGAGITWTDTQTVFILDETLPTEHFYFGVESSEYTSTQIPPPIDDKFNESFTITDGASAAFNVGLVIFLHEYHNFYVSDTFTASVTSTLIVDSAKERESFTLEDALSILLSGYADISQLLLENDVYIGLQSVSSSQAIYQEKSTARESFSVDGGLITSSVANPSISLQALTTTGSFSYEGIIYQLGLVAKMLAFGTAGTVKVLYFGANAKLSPPRSSPHTYNLGVVDGAVVYQLHQL